MRAETHRPNVIERYRVAIRDTSPGQRSTVTGMVVIASALALVALPFFMVGGLAVQIKADLGLTEASLGAAVTIGFVTGAIVAPFGGRIADRVGPRRAIYTGCGTCALVLIGLGTLTSNWATLVALLAIGGIAVAITDPGLAILVSRNIPRGRKGLAFGIKEASIPAASLLAGLAVPTVALTVGWRWAFVVGALPLAAVVFLLPEVLRTATPEPMTDTDAGVPEQPPPGRRALLTAAVAAGLGTTAASGVGIFLTDSAVAMGMSAGAAGILLAVGSIAGIITRIATGAAADRTGGPQFKLIAVMLLVGAATISLGATGNTTFLILATIGAFTGGWAWTGIFFLSLVETSPHRPGAVAGIGTGALGVGNAAGPVLFGLVAGAWSFEVAWFGAAVVAAMGAVLMSAARRQF